MENKKIHKNNCGAIFSENITCSCDSKITIYEFASLGGKARAEKLSKARRLEISRKANDAKKKKRAKLISA